MLKATYGLMILGVWLGNTVLPSAGNEDVVTCELMEKNQGELKVFGKKTDVPPKQDKCWHVSLEDPKREVVIVFQNFNLLESDRVAVYGADGNSTDLFGPFRGQRGVFSVFTGLSSVLVRLQTSSQKPWDRHFLAKYYADECNYEETVFSPSTFSSPLYGRDRVKPLVCSFGFTFYGSSSKLQKLVLSFLETNLTRGSYVQINGSEATDGKYNGENMPNKLLSSSRLQLTLRIDPVHSRFQHFLARYDLVTASCSSVIVLNGSVVTFGVPLSLVPSESSGVASSAHCHWILRSLHDIRIATNLLTDPALIGSRDSLVVGGPSFESLRVAPGGKNLWLGGDSVQSASNELWVTFTSPSIQPQLALHMQSTIHDNGNYLRNSGNFSVTPESGNSVGIFMLEVRSDLRVRLLLPKLRSTSLELHSDFDRSSVPFLRLTPGMPLENVVSPSNRMMVVVGSRFETFFDGVDRACHQVARLGEGDLYLAPRSCGNYSWLLPPSSESEGLVELRFLTLDLHLDDLVTLHGLDGDPSVWTTFRLGTTNPASVHVPLEKGILMKLTTRDRSGDRSAMQFSCVFKKTCRGNYELKSGQSIDLKSPLFPDRYPLGSTCRWDLHWKGGPILIRAHRVQLAHPTHRLSLGNVSLHPSTQSQLLMAEAPTRILFSAKASGKIIGEEDSAASSGFWITATALDCGGIVREAKGRLVIPSKCLSCVWVINATAAPSNIVTSVFLKTSSNSNHLHVSVYENLGKTPKKIELTANRELQIQRGLVFILYNRSASSSAEMPIQISYRTEECPGSLICGDNKCMSATWRCNGINECGDYGDETNCSVTTRPTAFSSPVTTGSKAESSDPTSTLAFNDSTRSAEGSLAGSSQAVSVSHVASYVAVAFILGATIPSSVYCCLLKRANGKRKTDSRWTMINERNSENADGISL